ncbi:MAG TPA: hypothetical protein VK614_08000 [Allosphingosinicella sp.]|nr:hypothetical protein [Allosphingosinicella sp.]
MNRLLSLSVTAAAAMLASAAPAEPPPGSRIDPAPGSVPRQDVGAQGAALRIMHRYSACVARSHQRWAEAMIALPFMSEEQANAVRRQQGGEEDCMGYSGLELSFRAPLLVGGMAEYLIESRYRAAPLAPVSQLADSDVEAGALAPRNGYEDLALCVVRRNPTAVRTLLRTPPASAAEQAAARGLAPDLGPCVPQGQTIAFGPPTLRGLLAVSFYKTLAAVTSLPGRN